MGLAHSPRIVTDGLVLALDAANTKSYGGSGTTWTDLSGEGNNGTISGATYSSSDNGYFDFDGTNDDVNIGNVLNQYPITISAWAKTSSTAAGANIVNKYTAGSANGYRLSFSSEGIGGYYFRDMNNRTNNYDTEYGTVSLNTWYHAVMTVDSSGIKFYLNASLVGSNGWTGTAQAPTTTTPLRIGFYPYNSGGFYYDGQISQVSIYNKALTASEVQQNFNALKGRYGI